MKAIVYTKYGSPDVLQLKEVEKPAPKDDEVLVKIHAASVNAYDWHLLTADIFLVRLMGGGLLKPKNTIPGADIAGRVEAVGRNVKQFQPGDEVFGDIAHVVTAVLPSMRAVPENAIGAETGQSDIRGSSGRAHGGTHRPAGSARSRTDSARAKGFDQWRVRRRGDVCGADCQIRSGLKSLPCAAPGIWTWRARWGQTMSSTTPKKISPKMGSSMT